MSLNFSKVNFHLFKETVNGMSWGTWIDGHIQRVVVNGSESQWTSVASDAFRGLHWDHNNIPSIFISDIDKGMECIPSRFADHTKLSGVVTLLKEKMSSRGTWKRKAASMSDGANASLVQAKLLSDSGSTFGITYLKVQSLLAMIATVEEQSDKAALVGTCHPAKINPPKHTIRHI
ncbi:hypothetical protein TURU_169262 [Turdus rufiventris]|nr:hypothetical protein TURU_169262 [Turdus rufiventris]